jgi:hypothetical protein
MQPLSSSTRSVDLTGPENAVNQKKSPSKQNTTGWSTNAKIGLGLTTGGILAWLALRDPTTPPPSSTVTISQKIVTGISIALSGIFVGGIAGAYIWPAKEEKIKSTPYNKIKLKLIETTDTPEMQKKALQEWWKLSGDYDGDREMPDLSPSDVETLYKILKSIGKKLSISSFSSNQIMSSPLDIYTTVRKSSLQVEFASMSDWEPASPISVQDFKKFFGGFILSQKTSFFAFQGDFKGTRWGFQIFPNNNFEIGNSYIEGNDPVLYTREGTFEPKNLKFKIGNDGVCRLVKENDEAKNELTADSNQKEVPTQTTPTSQKSETKEVSNKVTDTAPQTPKESLEAWWKLSGTSSIMPNLTVVEIDTLYNIFKNIKYELGRSPDKTIDNALMSIKKDNYSNSLKVTFNIEWTDYPKPGGYKYPKNFYMYYTLPISQNQFAEYFGGFILSQEKSFFGFIDGSGKGNFRIFPNKNCKLYSDSTQRWYTKVGMAVAPLVTREGCFDRYNPHWNIGLEWKIDGDGVCRLVKEDEDEGEAVVNNTLLLKNT